MGLFYDAFNVNALKEAEVDGQQIEDNTQTQDYTDDTQSQDNNPQDSTPDEPNDENPQSDDNDDDGYEPTDYTDDNSEGSDDEPTDNNASDNTEEAEVNDIKKQEEELLSNLTPEQLDIKHKELKDQFSSMFDIINSTIERIGDAAVNVDNINTIEYVSNKLSELKDMIIDYMKSVYSTKSYIENSINYNRFLATLNGINKILEEIIKKED